MSALDFLTYDVSNNILADAIKLSRDNLRRERYLVVVEESARFNWTALVQNFKTELHYEEWRTPDEDSLEFLKEIYDDTDPLNFNRGFMNESYENVIHWIDALGGIEIE